MNTAFTASYNYECDNQESCCCGLLYSCDSRNNEKPITMTYSTSGGLSLNDNNQPKYTFSDTKIKYYVQFLIQSEDPITADKCFAVGIKSSPYNTISILENETLSIIFYLDKKLNWFQKLMYSLLGFKYRINRV